MLTVYLIRCFTHDLVEHVARCRDPRAFVPLSPELRRHLGIGNATGLGMAPYLVSHPILLHKWVAARETALARVRAVETASSAEIGRFLDLLARAARHVGEWRVDDDCQMGRIECLRREISEALGSVDRAWLTEPRPWDRLIEKSAGWSVEMQELSVALVLEPYGHLIDDLCDEMASDVEPWLDPAMTCERMGEIVERYCDWALSIDFSERHAQERFWYASEEKLEPRLGYRFAEDGAELEMPLAIARDIQDLARALEEMAPEASVAELLVGRPELRYVARRIQTLAAYPYSEIRDNLIGADIRPIDMLRFKLSFFGAAKFDPKSDLWTRINMYQGAPTPDELANDDADDWAYPVLEAT